MHASLRTIRSRIAAALLLSLTAAASHAQATRSDCALRVASGPAGKIYELMVQDMQTVCGAAVRVCSVASSGGLQNLSLLSANEADLGIVQVDTLLDMKSGDDNIRTLQAVMPLHANLLHVLTLAAGSAVDVKVVFGVPVPHTGRTAVVRKFSELKGLSVAVVGSALLMGQALEKQLGYGMKFVLADSDDQAIALLRANQVQAVFTLGGWPLPSVARHAASSGLMLAEFDPAPQPPHITVKRNYQGLDAFNRTFLGVLNLLVTRPFRAGGPMANRVAFLQSCLKTRLDELQEGRYQAAWKEIKEPTHTYGVTAFDVGNGVAIGRAPALEANAERRRRQ